MSKGREHLKLVSEKQKNDVFLFAAAASFPKELLPYTFNY